MAPPAAKANNADEIEIGRSSELCSLGMAADATVDMPLEPTEFSATTQ
jgi:hypothetical protein